MLCNNMEGILEVTRVYGNLSQYQDVQDFILEQNVYKFIVALLDSGKQDVCFSACGVLINLANNNKKALLKGEGAIDKLVECLRDFGCSDWQLAGLVCKAFWNFMDDAGLILGLEETNKLLDLLSSFLDEQIALDHRWNLDLMDYQRECWEVEFKPVASQLLDKIHSHHSYLEPLPEQTKTYKVTITCNLSSTADVTMSATAGSFPNLFINDLICIMAEDFTPIRLMT
ncbi:unnamed protein product [Ranitomeya imitator]|uniref:Armadillo repeat-containing protein 2 n=1 Tax=Ranitomeya imitator TaxID=111125 RepID=A0ABN9LDW2_9NEOB|nr:unnamed protein product [Ranitomeya imitator]